MNNAQNQKLDAALQSQNWPLLVRLCKQVLRKSATHHQAHRLLGFALHRLHEDEQAIKAFSTAVVYWPNDAELLLNYGQTLMENGMDFQSMPLLEKATKLRPNKYLTWLKLSQAYYRCQMSAQGFECSKKLTQLAQNDEEKINALLNLAIHVRELGDVKGAIKYCEDALTICPTEMAAHTNRLLFLLADPDVKAETLREAADAYALAIEPIFSQLQTPHDASHRSSDERLRLGFLSPDFRNHSVMYFMEGVLAQMDRRQFTVVGLNLYGGTDAIAKRAKVHSDEFIDMSNRPFDEQLTLLREAKIDILIDLAGHTGNNGLTLMASKTAPVQATWIGYPGTTGLSSIDYLITDEFTDPTGVDHLYKEKLLRLNSRLCVYRPLIRNPLFRYQPAYAVNQTPAIKNKFITFGSCNNLGKLTDRVLSTWARIVHNTPNSKLLIEGKNFDNPEICSNYLDRCQRLGFDKNQLILVPLDARNQYLTYHQIDIALDPFPLNGGTTSMDVLWMGVPLIAMEGRSFRDRLTAGILLQLGRTEWLASCEEDYINNACNLAKDIESLDQTRQKLRLEVEQSILMREDKFCHRFGLSLREVWLHWLATQKFPNDQEKQQDFVETSRKSLPLEWNQLPRPEIGLETGKRIPLTEAQEKMEKLLSKAKITEGQPVPGADYSNYPNWVALTDFCDTVLCAIPNEPLALACLAEVEHAFGHTDFAVTYLEYAQIAIAQNFAADNQQSCA